MVAAGQGSVERILFYGSRARGTGSPASDWDFIVVLRDGAGDIEAREALFRSAAVGSDGPGERTDVGGAFRVDVWPIEKSEWESACELHGHPIRTAEREGVALYGCQYLSVIEGRLPELPIAQNALICDNSGPRR
jgi:hypothetical protein